MSYTSVGPPVFKDAGHYHFSNDIANEFSQETKESPFQESESNRDRKNWKDKKKSKTYMKRFMAKHGVEYVSDQDDETLKQMVKSCKTRASRRARQTPKNHKDPVLKKTYKKKDMSDKKKKKK